MRSSTMVAPPYAHGAPPAPAPAFRPVAVVSPQFCAPHAVPLTVTKKDISGSGRDFVITDGGGVEMLRVIGAVFSLHHRRVLFNAAAKQPLLNIRAKVISMHNRWQVFRGNRTKASDLLFTAKKSSLLQPNTEVDVFLAGNNAQHVCDFKIKGSYIERSCGFYLGNSDIMLAQIKRKYTAGNVLLGKDTFVVTVFPHVDYVFVAALAVILDEIHRDDVFTISNIASEIASGISSEIADDDGASGDGD